MSLDSDSPDVAADAGQGGTGAPPPSDAANRVPVGLTREYADERVRVQWFASRCIHSAECIRAAPGAFDPRKRPWVDIGAADAETIVRAVLRCPTGALQVERLDGVSIESPPTTVQVTVGHNGPYYVRGDVELVDEQGQLIRRDTRMALCRCGQSKHKPMCDNTHRTIRFRAS